MGLSAEEIASEIAQLRAHESADLEERMRRLASEGARRSEMTEYAKRIGLDETVLRLFSYLESVFLAPARPDYVRSLNNISQSMGHDRRLREERLKAATSDLGISLLEAEERKVKSGGEIQKIKLGHEGNTYQFAFRRELKYGEDLNDESFYGSGKFEIFLDRKQCFGMTIEINVYVRCAAWKMVSVYILKPDHWTLNIVKLEQGLRESLQ